MKRLVLLLVLIVACVLPRVRAQAPASPDLALSDLDKAQLEIVHLNEQLRIARAQRADCETTLGPLEVAARGAENQRSLDDLKKVIEARHPGAEFDVATGTLKPKSEPPKKDEKTEPKKDAPGARPGGSDVK